MKSLMCPHSTSWRFVIFVLLALMWMPTSAEARPKKDVIVMKNGDRITCEIKNLEKGQLSIKTDYTTGTILVDWEQVDHIETPQRFQIETQDGTRYEGALKSDDTVPEDVLQDLKIYEEDSEQMVSRQEVVGIRQLDRGFWERLDGPGGLPLRLLYSALRLGLPAVARRRRAAAALGPRRARSW